MAKGAHIDVYLNIVLVISTNKRIVSCTSNGQAFQCNIFLHFCYILYILHIQHWVYYIFILYSCTFNNTIFSCNSENVDTFTKIWVSLKSSFETWPWLK